MVLINRMEQRSTRNEIEGVYSQEPRTNRQKMILEKYPQIKELFGYDPNFKWVVTLMVLMQMVMMFLIKDQSWTVTILAAYFIGGVINHSLMLGVLEISRNLAFGKDRPILNQIFGFFVNLPTGLPFSISFKKCHLESHRYQGDELKDTNIPSHLEAKLFCTTAGKFFWMILQPFFYVFRPLLVYPRRPTTLEFVNLVIQLTFDGLVWYFLGGHVLCYLIFGSILAMGMHPMTGQFIAEHYMRKKGYETYSYYGPLNWITFNAGYHNEQQDFPAVPSTRLPKVKKIASEYYDCLPHHDSWSAVVYDFVMDPDIGPYTKIKRKVKALRE